jgi:hypothetical protein
MATVVPTGLEGLGPALDKLGAALGQKIFAEQIHQRETQERLSDPKVVRDLSDLVYVTEQTIAEQAGPPPIGGGIQGHQHMADMLAARDRAIESIAQGMGLHSGVFREAMRIPESEDARREVLRRHAGIDDLAVTEEVEGLRAGISTHRSVREQSEIERRLATAMGELNLPEFEAGLQLLEAQLRRQGTTNQLNAAVNYVEMIRQLPPELQFKAILAFENPRFLDHLEHLDNLELRTEELLLRLRSAGIDEMESQIALTLRVDSQVSDVMDRIRTIEEDGEAAEGELALELVRLGELAALRRSIAPEIERADGTKGPMVNREVETFLERRLIRRDRGRIQINAPEGMEARLANSWEMVMSHAIEHWDEDVDVRARLAQVRDPVSGEPVGAKLLAELEPNELLQFVQRFRQAKNLERVREQRERDPRREGLTPVGQFLDDILLLMGDPEMPPSGGLLDGPTMLRGAREIDRFLGRTVEEWRMIRSQIGEAWSFRGARD